MYTHMWKNGLGRQILLIKSTFNLFLTIEIIKVDFNGLNFRWIRDEFISRISFHMGPELPAYFL